MNLLVLALIYYSIVTWFKYAFTIDGEPLSGWLLKFVAFLVAIPLAFVWNAFYPIGSFLAWVCVLLGLWILPYGFYLFVRKTIIPTIGDLLGSIFRPKQTWGD